jgi:SAM-dependent methyltransferase
VIEVNSWDQEYSRRGIPSSFRDEPSGVVRWALDNWNYLTDDLNPKTALDIGCGTGRNAVYMAALGIDVIAFDISETALASAHARTASASLASPPKFLNHDLSTGIPCASDQIDFAIDVFVYKHQLLPSTRAAYRQELCRILRPSGRLLISLAERDDGYYASCPDLEVAESGNPRTVLDPEAGIGSVLFNLDDLVREMNGLFALQMVWRKQKRGQMHGKDYLRHTIATIWDIKE